MPLARRWSRGAFLGYPRWQECIWEYTTRGLALHIKPTNLPTTLGFRQDSNVGAESAASNIFRAVL